MQGRAYHSRPFNIASQYDLRVAEVTEQDVQIEDGKIELYRTKLKLSFKFEGF